MNKKGFTLIELLVVISIIGLLSSVVLASLNSARVKARDAKRLLELRQIKTALEYYYNDNGYYPSIGADDTGPALSGLATPLAPYLPNFPTDPSNIINYYVRGPVGNSSYGILFYTENSPGDYCITGVNINPGWWATGGYPQCDY